MIQVTLRRILPLGFMTPLVLGETLVIKEQLTKDFPLLEPLGFFLGEMFPNVQREKFNHKTMDICLKNKSSKINFQHLNRYLKTNHPTLKASENHPVTQIWYAQQGTVTQEMEFIAIRENLGRQQAFKDDSRSIP